MIEYLLLNIEYWKNRTKDAMLIFFVGMACCGCATAKSTSDMNMPTADVNLPPRAAVPHAQEQNEVDAILVRLDQKSREIKTYEAKIAYLFKQPLLESEAMREGMLYYVNDENGSKLRINFTSLRQDDTAVPNYREEYLFDGVYLTRVDYKLKNVEYRQLTDADKPLNAFELASEYLPIVGFTKADKLRDDFDITQIASKEYYELLLIAKPQSHYKNDYTQIHFWIEKPTWLPARMEATSPQDDISVIRLGEAKMNKELPRNVFTIDVPADFSKNIVPFEKGKN
jgi:outer membrane lipoprotein-sorting protein